MKRIFLFYSFLLIFAATSEISDTYKCKECEVGATVLDHFHPDYSEDDDDIGHCTDPCKPNSQFTSRMKIKNAWKALLDCSKVEMSCEERERSKYRTMDGSCNNLKNPSWGMANDCHRRILPHDYSDATYLRKSCTGGKLPPARVVSNALHRETEVYEDAQTFHFMEWGQIVAHDISLTNLPENPAGEACCDPCPKIDDVCIAEAVPPNDPFFIGKRTCLLFKRSFLCSTCNGSRQSLNQFTSHFDLSVLYGNDYDTSMKLRSKTNGMLKVQNIPGVGELPPPIEQAFGCKSLNSTHNCFLGGDFRIAQNPLITTTHIILLRNHNNICRRLMELNPHWNDEKLYMEARRINIAQAQYITHYMYIPIVIGPLLTSAFDVGVLPGDSHTKYDPEMDASVLDEVASAANRYGHSFVPDSVVTEDPETNETEVLQIRDYYFYPFDYYNGLLDRMALGMSKGLVRKHDPFYASSVRDWLLHLRDEKSFGGGDLAATTILRGREHGLPGYSYYLKFLFQHDVHSFCDLKRFIPPDMICRMRKLYKSVHDVDLYTGSLAEYRVRGTLLGPTFTALMIIQYQKMKFGDRYFFHHGNEAGSFTIEQLREIKKTNFAKMICDTTKIKEIQSDVFYPPSDGNPIKRCESIPGIDLSPWAEFEYKKCMRTL